jgi:hypothetical protein
MTIRRADPPDVFYMDADPVTLWCNGIVEWRIDTRNRKFLMTPILRDGSEWPLIDATDSFEKFLREQDR